MDDPVRCKVCSAEPCIEQRGNLYGVTYYIVACTHCNAAAELHYSKSAAIASWNMLMAKVVPDE